MSNLLYNSKTAAHTLAALHIAHWKKGFSVQALTTSVQNPRQPCRELTSSVPLTPVYERQKQKDCWGLLAASLVLGAVKDYA